MQVNQRTVFTPQGNNRDFFVCRDPEVIAAGPAETGKTYAALWKVHLCCAKYPNTSAIMMRKTLSSTFSTVLRMFTEKVLPLAPVCVPYGGAKIQWFDYPSNNSRLWVTGMDKASRILSGEHDIIFANQAEEFTLPEWETITTRTTGRAGHMPYNQSIADCNPGPPTHWIITRSHSRSDGKGGTIPPPLRRIDTTHKDNPMLYDVELAKWTAQGKHTLAQLATLTGSRYSRLFKGHWAAPEGAIYDFDEENQKVAAFNPPQHWPRVVGVDPVGVHTAAVWLAYDPGNKVVNVYREYHQPFGLTTPQHVDAILDITRQYQETIFAWCGGGPSERQARADWDGAGIPLLAPSVVDVWRGIDRISQLLRDKALVIHDSCPKLLAEIGDYRRKLVNGVPTEAIENKDAYHLLDSLRYAVIWLTEPTEPVTEEYSYQPVTIPGPVSVMPSLDAMRGNW